GLPDGGDRVHRRPAPLGDGRRSAQAQPGESARRAPARQTPRFVGGRRNQKGISSSVIGSTGGSSIPPPAGLRSIPPPPPRPPPPPPPSSVMRSALISVV